MQGFENANTNSIESIQQQITQIQDNANQQADQLRAEFVSTESQTGRVSVAAVAIEFLLQQRQQQQRVSMARAQRSVEQRYLETSIATASKEDLIVKIFDVLIMASSQALEKLQNEPGDIEGIHKTLLRAQRALCLLMGSLNMEIGGDVARNLFRVYEFWHHELVMANMQKSALRVERLMPNFKDYRAMWAQAIAEFKSVQRTATEIRSAGSFAAVG